jgi:hypothetical protein
MKTPYTLLLVTALFVLLLSLLPLIAGAHGSGLALAKVSGEYRVDIHYGRPFEAGIPVWLNLFIERNKDEQLVDFTDIDLIISQNATPFFQTNIMRKVSVGTGAIVTFPHGGPYQVFATFHGVQGADVSVAFDVSVGGASAGPGVIARAATFIRLGVVHILSGPDHLLFLLALMLTYISWRDILRLTGVFTLAHSMTLILSGTAVLSLSSRIVEPVIALSIAVVAFCTVVLRDILPVTSRHKAAVIFVFGLVHGLGFARALKDMHIPSHELLLSLVGFNLGIELGQLMVIGLVMVPLISWVRSRSWGSRAITAAGVILSIIGVVWGVQRIIGASLTF